MKRKIAVFIMLFLSLAVIGSSTVSAEDSPVEYQYLGNRNDFMYAVAVNKVVEENGTLKILLKANLLSEARTRLIKARQDAGLAVGQYKDVDRVLCYLELSPGNVRVVREILFGGQINEVIARWKAADLADGSAEPPAGLIASEFREFISQYFAFYQVAPGRWINREMVYLAIRGEKTFYKSR